MSGNVSSDVDFSKMYIFLKNVRLGNSKSHVWSTGEDWGEPYPLRYIPIHKTYYLLLIYNIYWVNNTNHPDIYYTIQGSRYIR